MFPQITSEKDCHICIVGSHFTACCRACVRVCPLVLPFGVVKVDIEMLLELDHTSSGLVPGDTGMA